MAIWRWRLCTAGAAVILLSAVATGPALAAASERTDPHTIVSSDGSTRTAPTATGTATAGYRGTARARPSRVRGPARRNSVIGGDNRVRIGNTTAYPRSAVVNIIRTDGGTCTGFMIGRDTVATAGHCVHPGGSNRPWYGIRFVIPGQNVFLTPYGSCGARWVNSVLGWIRDANEEYDYGVIKLDCTVGTRTGWYGMWAPDFSLANRPAIITGYPADKPAGTMWHGSDFITASPSRQLFYRTDTANGGGELARGDAGAPVFQNRPSGASGCGGGPCAIGVNTRGPHGSASRHQSDNHGTRINREVFNNYVSWINS